MDDALQNPKIFANKVIRQVIQHMVSEDIVIEPRDYLALRSVFRKCGGSWEKFVDGDQVQIELIKTIVTAWGQMPDRIKESNRVI
jgi:hypothetical protein